MIHEPHEDRIATAEPSLSRTDPLRVVSESDLTRELAAMDRFPLRLAKRPAYMMS
jgi:hypothetical protein